MAGGREGQTAGELGLEPVTSIEIDVLVRRVVALYEQGHLEAARQIALEVVSRRPDHVDALLNLAHVLRDMGRFDEALTVLRRIAKLDPNHAKAHAAFALTLFYKEDWARAWRAFDVRFKLMEQPPRVTTRGAGGKPVAIPPWRDGALPPTLLVIGEQGLGDTIQFARFIPLLTAAGTKVTLVVQRQMFQLLKTLDAKIDLRPIEEPGTVESIKGWTPLLHLPHALGIGPDRFASTIPYLRADPERVARFRARLGETGFKVGIVWQGNPDPRIDQGRSTPLAAFAPLAEIPGVRLISLQKGKGEKQIATVLFASRIETLGEDFDAGPDGFLDSAAAIECLDLVVTVDTAIAHLAGALRKPVFILLKRLGSDWRWLYGRDDTVWYPTVRLFRQIMPGDWTELLARVAVEVRRRAEVKLAASTDAAMPLTPVSVGELLDKLVILEIKSERITDPEKRANVERERAALMAERDRHPLRGGEIDRLVGELKRVNEMLWGLEDEIRDYERRKNFDARFVELSRSIYKTNDHRAALKSELNRLCGSALVEEKSYKAY